MKKLLYCLAITFLLSACEDTPRENVQSTETDVDKSGMLFIENGIKGGIAEITAAQMAKNSSDNPKVIEFANMIITDHDNIGKELKKLAEDRDVVVDNALTAEHQEMINGLQAKKGAAFDAAYIDMIVMDHEKDVQLFENETHNKTAAVQKVAADGLPLLKKHLQAAKDLQATLK